MRLKEQFVPYDLAVKLREKGFNEICIALITEKDFLIPLRFDDEEELEFNQEIKKHNNVPCIPTPSYQQACQWLMDKHNIKFGIHPCKDDSNSPNEFYLEIYKNNSLVWGNICHSDSGYYFFFEAIISTTLKLNLI